MFKKIIEFNQATQVWWEKQQGKLTKTQHIILTVFCLLYFIIATGTNENHETTIFNYFLAISSYGKYSWKFLWKCSFLWKI